MRWTEVDRLIRTFYSLYQDHIPYLLPLYPKLFIITRVETSGISPFDGEAAAAAAAAQSQLSPPKLGLPPSSSSRSNAPLLGRTPHHLGSGNHYDTFLFPFTSPASLPPSLHGCGWLVGSSSSFPSIDRCQTNG